MKMQIARNKDCFLWLFTEEPIKKKNGWVGKFLASRIGFLPEEMFPEVQWSDEEPTKVKLVIEK